MMKAIVFAAGIGSRLKPFTLHHPKALAPVNGTPALELVVERLKAAGVDELVINVHHFAEQVRDFVAARDNFGIRVHISDESDRLLETGGALVKAAEWLKSDSPFIVHNADIVTNLDLRGMYESHLRSGADVTLLATDRKTSRYLFFDKDGDRLRGWINEKTGEVRPAGFVPDPESMNKLAFGGVHVIDPKVLDMLAEYREPGTPFSLTPFYVDECGNLRIHAYSPDPDKFVWADIGTPESLQHASELIKNNI